MRILVAGGAGFIGSHLCAKLISENHDVLCVDNLFTGRMKNINALANSKIFEFVQHGWQHRFRRRGAENNQQLLADVTQQFE